MRLEDQLMRMLTIAHRAKPRQRHPRPAPPAIPCLVTAHTSRQRWCDQFDKIHNGVIRLFRDRAIWWTVLAVLPADRPGRPAGSTATAGAIPELRVHLA